MAKINPVKVKQDADKLEKAGKFDQAISLYRQLVDDNPRDWNTIKKIGDLYARLNKNREATEEYAKVADFYAKDGFLLKSIAIWKQINKLDPSALDPYLNLADLYSKQGLMMEAKSQYQIVVDEYIKRGKAREAGDVLKKMADIDPADLKVRSKLADLYMRDGSTGKAVEEHVAIADELTKKGHLVEALQVLEKGLKLDAKNPRLRGELARIYVVQKNYDKAIQHLEEISRESPNDAQVLFRLGEAYVGAKKLTEAEGVFRRLLDLDPNDTESHVQMGRVQLARGNADAAFDEFLPVVDRMLGRKEGDKAAALLQQIAQKAPNHVKTLSKMAEVYRMLKKDGAVVQTYSNLTEAYINDGQLEQAAGILEILVGMEPQNQQYKSKLEFVRQKQAAGGGAPAPAPAAAATLESDVEEIDFEDQAPTPAEPVFAAFKDEDVKAAVAPAPAAAAPAGPTLSRPVVESSGILTDEDREFIDEHLAEGKVFRKYGLVDKSGDQFEAIVARFPDHVEARQELRDVYREKGLNVKAAEQCLALAEIKRLAGDAAAVEAFEEEARALAPEAVPARAGAEAPVAAAPAPEPAPEPEAEPEPEIADESEVSAAPAVELDDEEEISISDDVDEAGIEPPAPEAEDLPSLDLGVEDAGEEMPDRFLEEHDVETEAAAEAPVEAEAPEPPTPEAPAEEAEFSLSVDSDEPEPAVQLEDEPAPPSAPAPLTVAAPAVPAPAASSLPVDLRRVLDEVESYVSLGFVDDAREALNEIAAKYPGHEAIQAKIQALGIVLDEPAEAPAPAEEPSVPEPEAEIPVPVPEPEPEPEAAPEPEPEPEPASATLEDESEAGGLASELDLPDVDLPEPEPFAELGLSEPAAAPEPEPELPSFPEPVAEPEPEPEPAFATVAAPPSEHSGGIDLGAELSDLFGAQSAVETPAASEASTELGDSGLEEIFKEFKRGVDKQLGKEDYDTRYNLGIAYKEMGLVDEAIAEFQLAAKDEGRVLECASMLGICFMDKGMPKLAVKWFEKGLAAPNRKEEEYIALRYDLAMAHEADGDVRQALSIYSDLYSQDSSFRDVSSKVRELKAALG